MSGISRREFIRLSGLAVGGALLAACAPAAPAPATQAPAAATDTPAAAMAATDTPAAAMAATDTPAAAMAATDTPAAAAAATATPAALGGKIADMPRNQTVNLGWSISSPIGTTSPWAQPGYTHQEGNAMMNEGLFYFAIFANKDIPWLAESMAYNADFSQLTIKLRKEGMWNDKVAFTSKDVIFLFDGQMKDTKRNYNAQFVNFVKDYSATDDQTVVVNFKAPTPRFKFEVLSLKFDTAVEVVPEHVLSKQADVNAYAGGLEFPHTGPYTCVVWDQNQKIFDLDPNWWAVKAGIAAAPAAKRIVMTNIGGLVGQNMDVVAQRVVNNEFDATLDMRSSVIGNILKQNAKVTTHAGNKPPYGYLDWWPNSLWVNTQLDPYKDPNIRKAMSLSINRDQIDQVIYEGAQISTIYPFPLYPNLVKFTELPEIKALVTKYNPREFNLDKSAALMTAAGYAKNGDGLWAKGGNTINCTIDGYQGIHSDLAPVLVEMLKAGGFDASVNFGADAGNNMADGKPGLYLFGHGASLIDPAAALDLYNGKYSVAVGTTAGGAHYSRYKNPDYDKITDAMAPLSSDDPKFTALAVQAMEIYWKETIDIPIIQWLHRIPYNQTYWTNWPTADNLGPGCNGAFWAHTGMLVITQLKPA